MTLAQLPIRFSNFVAMERAKPEAIIDIVNFFATVEFEERRIKRKRRKIKIKVKRNLV